MTRSVEILRSCSSSFDRSLEHFCNPFIRWAPVRKETLLSPQPRLQRLRKLLSTKLFRRLRRRTKPLSLPRVIVSVLSRLKERRPSYTIHCSFYAEIMFSVASIIASVSPLVIFWGGGSLANSKYWSAIIEGRIHENIIWYLVCVVVSAVVLVHTYNVQATRTRRKLLLTR